MQKYKLTEKTITITRNGVEIALHQIEALRDFADVKVGDKGGFVESEINLSHDGTCWVYDNAKVYDNARVYGNAKICGNTEIRGNIKVCGNTNIND